MLLKAYSSVGTATDLQCPPINCSFFNKDNFFYPVVVKENELAISNFTH